MCLPVSVPQLCLSASIYQLEFEFPIRCVVLSENCCTSSPNKYNNMIIISSTCTEPSSSQRDTVHFEKIHSKHGGSSIFKLTHTLLCCGLGSPSQLFLSPRHRLLFGTGQWPNCPGHSQMFSFR